MATHAAEARLTEDLLQNHIVQSKLSLRDRLQLSQRRRQELRDLCHFRINPETPYFPERVDPFGLEGTVRNDECNGKSSV